MYTIFSVVQRQQMKSDVMTYFGLAACSAIAGSSLGASTNAILVTVSYAV
jgi:hypothetical protein